MTPNQLILQRLKRVAAGTLKPGVATLHSARIVQLASSTGNFCLKGRIEGDPQQRFADGTLVSTTGVASMHIDPATFTPVFRTQSGNYYIVASWRLA